MAKTVRIFVGCGSGIATSNMAKAKVDAILKDAGIAHEIKTGNVAEMKSQASNYDLFLVTTTNAEPMERPVIPVFGLLSGIGAADVKQKVIDACKHAAAE